AHREQAQRARLAQMIPPGVLPLPGQERTVRNTIAQQFVPVQTQFRERGRVLHLLDDHSRPGATWLRLDVQCGVLGTDDEVWLRLSQRPYHLQIAFPARSEPRDVRSVSRNFC